MSRINFEGLGSNNSVDSFFTSIKKDKQPSAQRVRVASASALSGFTFVGKNTLVHTSQQDFWKLGQDSDGFYVEKLVEDNNGPVEGLFLYQFTLTPKTRKAPNGQKATARDSFGRFKDFFYQ